MEDSTMIKSELGRTSDKKRSLKMWGDYIDNSLRVLSVAILANSFERLFCVLRELGLKHNLPEERYAIFRRGFTYKNSSLWLMTTVLAMVLVRFGLTRQLALPSAKLLAYMPLYWIFNAAEMGRSTLSYAHWIREPHGLDCASGLASNYFHGYLNLALPARNGNEGLRKRIENYENDKNVTFGIQRLVILIPDEMFVNSVIKSDFLEEASPLETVYINRAGVNRPFKHAVYRLKHKTNGKFYYFAVEGATPMLSFFESMNFQLSTTPEMRELKREIWLKFYKHLKKLLDTWPETRHEVKLMIYKAHKENGELVDVGELLQTLVNI
ncbi:uncharacterized protein LOC115630611 [Scaptodrosophila lebanonensis]|uniref:Uncharacterized protein LOC115630611 n=1 Tax=Drosophila lebanonensis TaxID=7225 RepID=A0A6J2U3X8_DROLE|nr:uncharacterized protein LOC115630611 [Scaptodrosophila lebanonensis]